MIRASHKFSSFLSCWYPLVLTIILAFICIPSIAQKVLSNRIANYDMEIRLDENSKKLHCKTQLTWTNPSADTVDHLLFHLYYNAFKNSNSTFMKERGVPDFLLTNIDEECGWGWSNVDSMTDKAGNQLMTDAEYIQPDDGNTSDQTVLQVPLAKAVGPYETITIQYDWTAQVPMTMPRTGYNKEYFFFAQWFPKVGVYEPAGMRYAEKGGWNCHQYHSAGEYYSDFGVYDVKLTVPLDYVVASSGQLIGQEKGDSSMTWNYYVEDVIDFTWSASPHFEVTEDKYKDTEIRYYSYPEKTHFATRYLNSIKYCMQYLEEQLGPYPYPTLTIVDPPIHGLFTGGMEYPTLITALSFNMFPAGFKTPETLVVHEFIHQYFMQMVATHEVEEAWMDEGLTTYYESRILDSYMSDSTSTIEVMGINAGNKEWNRAEFFGFKKNDIAPNTLKSWQFKEGSYGPICYNKTALWLQTLEGLVGVSTVDEIMKTYFEQWRFKHPCRTDFVTIANAVTKKNHPDKFSEGLDWYFDQVLYGTVQCDYAVNRITNDKAEQPRGYVDDNENCISSDGENTALLSKVVVCRNEGMQLPVELVVRYEDGSQETRYWDGKDSCKSFEFSTDLRIAGAEIDPERKIMMDKNFLNNSLLVEKEVSGVRKLFARLITSAQHLFETVAIFI